MKKRKKFIKKPISKFVTYMLSFNSGMEALIKTMIFIAIIAILLVGAMVVVVEGYEWLCESTSAATGSTILFIIGIIVIGLYAGICAKKEFEEEHEKDRNRKE